MCDESKPESGFYQPGTGLMACVGFPLMTRKSKRDKGLSIAVTVVAQNVVSLRDEVFAAERTTTARNLALAKAAGTTLSQIQRIAAGQLACGVDLLESL